MTISVLNNKAAFAAYNSPISFYVPGEKPTSAEVDAAVQEVFGKIPEKMTQDMINKLGKEKGEIKYNLQLTKNMDEVEEVREEGFFSSRTYLQISYENYKKYIARRD